MSLAGKTAIVTGAGTGIGRATAQLLAQRGARVVAAGLQPDRLRETVDAITSAGGEAIAVDAARAHLEAQGVRFVSETMDSGVCHQAIFLDPAGNSLGIHHRYAPKD